MRKQKLSALGTMTLALLAFSTYLLLPPAVAARTTCDAGFFVGCAGYPDTVTESCYPGYGGLGACVLSNSSGNFAQCPPDPNFPLPEGPGTCYNGCVVCDY